MRLLGIVLLLMLSAAVTQAKEPSGSALDSERVSKDPSASSLVIEDQAQAPQVGPDEASTAEWSAMQDIAWTFISLTIVLGLIWVVFRWVIPRFMGVALFSKRPIAVIERIPLDNKAMLYLVNTPDDLLLIGRAEGSISLIDRIDATRRGHWLSELSQRPSVRFWPKGRLEKTVIESGDDKT